jgi:hypothetical protein
MALLPKIEKVAVEGYQSARSMAVERLQSVPECKEFLAGDSYRQEIGAASSENGLFIAKMEFSIRTRWPLRISALL